MFFQYYCSFCQEYTYTLWNVYTSVNCFNCCGESQATGLSIESLEQIGSAL
ncbi:hypothetical protein [Peribacillus acanthi]|uniref:hypothetical protein n=1 Tax=Peribacillus acanthi TaxID=2171554 RepID=UPI0013007127|nr:hypothetical protein [Peribacillus acanthi]